MIAEGVAVKLGKLFATLLALTLLLTACPAADEVDVVDEPDVAEEPEVEAPEEDDEPAPPADGDPLQIGIVIMLSGVYAQLGEDIVDAMELYFETVGNQTAGRPIELIVEDETMDTGTALERTRRLVEVEQVDILSGLISTGSAYAVAEFVEESQTPFVISNAGGNDLARADRSPYIVRTSFTNWQNNYAVGEWYYENIGETVALIASDYAAGHEHVGGFLESFEAAGGSVVDEVYTPLGSTDFSAALGRLGASGADGLYGFLAGTDGLIFVREYADSGLKDQMPLVASGFMVEEDVLAEIGEAAVGVFSGLHWAYDLDNEANQQFVADFEEAYGRSPTVYAVQGWDTARVIVEAVEELGGDTSDAEALIQAMLGVSFDSPRGPFRLDPNTHNPVHHVYLREVVEMNGEVHNTMVEDLGELPDPGA
jgi:branched-chain amino acid transport system substrate-binding protein